MLKFPELEDKVLKFWQDHDIFEKSLAQTKGGKPFVFWEGPPTANGKPGLHHVLARAFKDLIPRYKTMRGFRVERKAGWDTQGLPVELQVEKDLKFKGKPDIEKYGVAEFNARCREDVWKYKADWEKLTTRMGYWLDLEHPYVTYENYYLESLWWIFKQIANEGLLYQDYKVLPHCPRCGTALSSHEVAQGYQSVSDQAVYVKFRMKRDPKVSILSWTTTPWTLPGNVALAVGEDIDYLIVEAFPKVDSTSSLGQYILAKEILFNHTRDGGLNQRIGVDEKAGEWIGRFEIVKGLKGKDLVGLEYQPLYDIEPLQNEKSHRVYAADFVTTTDGTGVVHTAVMYGEDDFALGTKEGLPKYHTVDEAGKFTKDVPEWQGKFVKNAEVEKGIIADLKARGLLFKEESYTHDYPFCWRCSTPLLYYAKPSWFIKMSSLRKDLQAANEKIHWYPDHIQHGRFGEWLDGVKDWAISRERYWGTPLPIWVCTNADCKHQTVVESLKELSEKSGRKFGTDFDMHRPFIDKVAWPCKQCKGKGEMRRVAEVADCWFDSGSMPFAQWGYPHAEGSKEQLKAHYPADYISEAIDQTRGWFYTLLAVATLLKKAGAIEELPPYKNVICLGHINDKHGQKMSKSKGNIVDPWEIMNTYGADALRFHFYTASQPGEPKNFDPSDVDSVVKKTFLILMNCVAFYHLDQLKAEAPHVPPHSEHVMDRWVLALWHKTVAEVTEYLDAYKITEAGRALADFVTELSTWYIRRSRERYKNGGLEAGNVRTTLGYVLRQLAITLAPFTPFVAEEVYQEVKGGKESVHLESWPEAHKFDRSILDEMQKVRTVVEQALAQRAAAGIKIRQTLRKLQAPVPEVFRHIVAEEVNVLEVVEAQTVELDTKLDDELKAMGLVREFVRQVNALRKKQGLTIKDRVVLKVGTDEVTWKVLSAYREDVLKGALARELQQGEHAKYSSEVNLDGVIVTVIIEV